MDKEDLRSREGLSWFGALLLFAAIFMAMSGLPVGISVVIGVGYLGYQTHLLLARAQALEKQRREADQANASTQARVVALEALVVELQRRLDAGDGSAPILPGEPAARPQPQSQPEQPALSQLVEPAQPLQPQPDRSPPAKPERPAVPRPVPPEAAHPERPKPPVRPTAPPRPPFDWDGAWRSIAGPLEASGHMRDAASAEARIGTVWFSRIGALLLIIGGIFAFRYGVTSNAARTLIGYAAGVSLLGLGHWGHRKEYRLWSQAISGGGLGLLYLTTTAAAVLLDPPVLPRTAAFGLMVLITALGTGLAIWYDAIAVGVLGMVGGFATPFLLSEGSGDFRVLFAYMAILDAGLLLTAYFKRWPLYNYLVFVATWAIYGFWRGASFQPGDGPWAFCFASVFFAIFALVSITYNIVHREQSRYQDLALVLINGFVYFGSGLDLLSDPIPTVLRGFFAFAVAAVYLALGYVTLRRNGQDRMLILTFLGLAGIFLTVAFPVALNGPWITVAWALEGAALVWIGHHLGAVEAVGGGLAVLAVTALRLTLWETFPEQFGDPLPAPFMRAFTFLISAGAYYLAAGAYARFRGNGLVLGSLAVAGNLFTLWYITLEILLHYSELGPVADGSRTLAFAGAWALYGLAVALADLRFAHYGVRNGARLVLALGLGWLVVEPFGPALETAAPSLRLFGYGATLGSIWLAEWTIRRRGLDAAGGGWLSMAAATVGLFAVGREVRLQLQPLFVLPIGQARTPEFALWRTSTRTFAVTAAWGAYSLAAMAAGVVLRSAATRLLAGAFFTGTFFFGVLAGLSNLAAVPGLRAAAFLASIPGAWLAVWLAYRFGGPDRPPIEARLLSCVSLGAAAVTAAWGAAEISALLMGGPHGLDSARLGSLAWLGLYALAVGRSSVWLRSPEGRWLAMAIQGVTLVGLLASTPGNLAPWPLKLAACVLAIFGIYASAVVFGGPDRSAGERAGTRWLALAACVLTILWAGFEIQGLFAAGATLPPGIQLELASQRNHWILLALGLYGLAVAGAGIWLRSAQARLLGMAYAGLSVAGAVTVGAVNAAAPHWLRVVAFLAAVGSVYAILWLLRRFVAPAGAEGAEGPAPAAGQRPGPGDGAPAAAEVAAARWLSLAAAAITVAWLSQQMRAFFAPFVREGTQAEQVFARSTWDFAVSAVWGVYGFGVLATGFVLRHRWTRVLGLAIMGLTLAKIGANDMWRLAVQWRIWVTVGLGLIFVVASFLYQRFGKLIIGEDGGMSD